MVRLFLLTSIFLTTFFPSGIRAQDQLSFKSLMIDLWPEFDRPNMLVMYQISLSEQVKLPTELNLRIPASAGVPNAVAVCQPDGSCFNTPYEQKPPVGEWSTLVIQATLPDLRVEYYDPQLIKEGSNRHFEYRWPGDFAVESFKIKVQQPPSAREMSLKPGMVSASVAEDGMTYYNLDVGTVPAGQTVALQINYQKDNDDLTFNALTVEPSEPLGGQNATGRFSISTALPFILGALGITLIAGGGLWYWLSGRQKTQPAKRVRRSRRKRAVESIEEGEVGIVYCHQCGNRASPGDRFCRLCGAQLRGR